MAVGTVQLFDGFTQYIMDGTIPLWETAGSQYYGSVWTQTGSAPSDSLDDYTAVDAVFNLATGDGATLKDLASRAIVGTAPVCGFDSAIANWGSSVTVTAKWFICFDGDYASSAGTDKAIFWVNLYDGDNTTEVSSSAGTFSVDASASGWFYIAGQA